MIVPEKGFFCEVFPKVGKGVCVCVIMHAEKIRVLKVGFLR